MDTNPTHRNQALPFPFISPSPFTRKYFPNIKKNPYLKFPFRPIRRLLSTLLNIRQLIRALRTTPKQLKCYNTI